MKCFLESGPVDVSHDEAFEDSSDFRIGMTSRIEPFPRIIDADRIPILAQSKLASGSAPQEVANESAGCRIEIARAAQGSSEPFSGLDFESVPSDRKIELGEISKLLPTSPSETCSLKVENDDLLSMGVEIAEMEVAMTKASVMKHLDGMRQPIDPFVATLGGL